MARSGPAPGGCELVADDVAELMQFIGGSWVSGRRRAELADKCSGQPVALVHQADRDQVGQATRGVAAAQAGCDLTPYQRYEFLSRAATLLESRAEKFVEAIMSDTCFTRAESANEVRRAQQTLLLSGEEAKRLTGEMVPMDAAPGGSRRLAFTLRAPLGVVCAITPFNSPLNTVLHKVAPALAAGNGVVLKPSAYTPITAGLVIELLLDAGAPPGLLALVHGSGSTVGQWLAEDPVPSFYAFTGSTQVGEHLKRTVGLRRAQLELGSLSSTIVCQDADLDALVPRCLDAAFRKSGQVCTSVQRLYVQEGIVGEFVERASAYLAGRRAADPRTTDAYLGPVISTADATRIRAAVDAALSGGARLLHGETGGDGPLVDPIVLTDVSTQMSVMRSEIFGPVVSVRPFRELAGAVAEANQTPYGLSAGVFTRDLGSALWAARNLRFGTVNINETSSARLDLMPFGGVKASGTGREGPHYAVREMTEERLVTIQA